MAFFHLFVGRLGLDADDDVGVGKVEVGCEVTAGNHADESVSVSVATARGSRDLSLIVSTVSSAAAVNSSPGRVIKIRVVVRSKLSDA